MNWQDLLINKPLSVSEIIIGLSDIFNVNNSDILVVDEIPSEPLPSNIKVLGELSTITGDFEIMLSIYLRTEELFKQSSEVSKLVERFCEKLNCCCLIDDNSVNPSSWLMIKGHRRFERVYLDPENMDNERDIIVKMEKKKRG
jgi:hypothetical protein